MSVVEAVGGVGRKSMTEKKRDIRHDWTIEEVLRSSRNR